MAGETLREFLVTLGFNVDEATFRRMSDTLASITKSALAMAGSVETAKIGVLGAVTAMASGLEDLWNASQRTKTSAQNIEAFTYAASQLGATTEQGRSSLETFADHMRHMGPGITAFLRSLGVATTDAAGHTRQYADILVEAGQKIARSAMPEFQKMAYLERLIGPNATDMMRAFQQDYAGVMHEHVARQEAAGASADDAAASSHGFMQSLRRLGDEFRTLKEKYISGVVGPLGVDLDKFREAIEQNQAAISRVLTTISTVVMETASGLETLAVAVIHAGRDIYNWFQSLPAATQRGIEVIAGLTAAFLALNVALNASPLRMLTMLGTGIAFLVGDYEKWKESGGKDSFIDWGKWQPELEHAQAALKGLEGPLNDLLTALGDWASKQTKATGELGKTQGEADKANKVLQDLKETLEGLADLLEGRLSKGFHELWNSLNPFTEEGLNTILPSFLQFGKPTAAPAGKAVPPTQKGPVTEQQKQGWFDWLKGAFSWAGASLIPSAQGAEPGAGGGASVMFGGLGMAGGLSGMMGMMGGGGSPRGVSQDDIKSAMTYLTQHGWTAQQAAGIVANFVQESGLHPNIMNASGHFGLAQWDAQRRAGIERHFGKPMAMMNLQEQLEAFNWEVSRGGPEANAGEMMRGATSAFGEAATMTHFMERPGNEYAEMLNRGRLATQIEQQTSITVNGATDPHETAQKVGAVQNRVNEQLVRTTMANAS